MTGKFSIKDLEKLSGIKAHTLRIWEKRHAIISPKRTDTNIRFYTDDDLKKIINVAILNNNGMKISKIADLSIDAITEEVIALSESNNAVDIHVDRLIVAMLDLDELHFEKVLSDVVIKYGFERVVTEILYLFLEKIGILWTTGNIHPAHEHFISSLIRQKMLVAIDSLPITTDPDAKKVLLFLPESELHEIGLLFYQYLYKKHGYKTIYLGQSVPFEDIVSVNKTHNPEVLMGAIVSNPLQVDLEEYVQRLASTFSDKKIVLTGAAIIHADFTPPSNVHIIQDSKDALTYIV